MSSKRRVRCALALALLSVTFSVGRSQQVSHGDSADLPYDPFALHPADEGALRWEDLSRVEQDREAAAMEWAETQHGEAVHNAFAAATMRTSEVRAIHDAQSSTNLEGVETLGVVP